ncbi:MAG: hypothetical protein HOU81_09350 [Hamadaea sp.]|uniref:hypothetical protein n=1 Tax=Hamadaea sp. TaxID=2024425 RepID=UPI0017E18E79|nr:hypothetical protein [Hamadaea sp.]NUR71015.1 hypothetical protein [Hamadaea sp.]NUT23696.1 hypothetical protein [Hamadaea sp.]
MIPEPGQTIVADRIRNESTDQRPRDFAEVADAGDQLSPCHTLNHTDQDCTGRHQVGLT